MIGSHAVSTAASVNFITCKGAEGLLLSVDTVTGGDRKRRCVTVGASHDVFASDYLFFLFLTKVFNFHLIGVRLVPCVSFVGVYKLCVYRYVCVSLYV